MKKFCLGLPVIGAIYCAAFASPAAAAIATFDNLLEGFSSRVLTIEGIVFSDLDRRQISPNPSFVVERADDSSLPLDSPFSPPNILTFGGYVPGSGYGFGRFGSARISTGSLASDASLDIFDFPRLRKGSNDSIITLEAYLDGTLVGSNNIIFDTIVKNRDDFKSISKKLSISNVVFDELRLIASGTEDQGIVAIGIDNVRVNNIVTVPEPSAGLGQLAVGILGTSFMLKRLSKTRF